MSSFVNGSALKHCFKFVYSLLKNFGRPQNHSGASTIWTFLVIYLYRSVRGFSEINQLCSINPNKIIP